MRVYGKDQSCAVKAPSVAHRALNLEKRKSNAGLPVLGRLRKAQTRKGEQRRVGGIGSYKVTRVFYWGKHTLRMRLLSVSRILVWV